MAGFGILALFLLSPPLESSYERFSCVGVAVSLNRHLLVYWDLRVSLGYLVT